MASNHLQRVMTAAIMVPVVLGVIIFAPTQLFAVAAAALALLTLREYLDLAEKLGLAPIPYAGYAIAAVVVLWPLLGFGDDIGASLMVIVTLTLAMHPSRDLRTAGGGAASTVFGVLYTALPFALLVRLRMGPAGGALSAYVLVIIWVSDTAAYYGGRLLGRGGIHKLAPRVSPGKTWEGTICSTIAAAGAGYLYLHIALPEIPLTSSLIMAVTVNIAGQLGDLAESALKRGAGVKDSGTLLPGHGGALDRVDALLFAIPVLWYDVILLAPTLAGHR